MEDRGLNISLRSKMAEKVLMWMALAGASEIAGFGVIEDLNICGLWLSMDAVSVVRATTSAATIAMDKPRVAAATKWNVWQFNMDWHTHTGPAYYSDIDRANLMKRAEDDYHGFDLVLSPLKGYAVEATMKKGVLSLERYGIRWSLRKELIEDITAIREAQSASSYDNHWNRFSGSEVSAPFARGAIYHPDGWGQG